MVTKKNTGTTLLVLASGFFGLFNSIALALFLWAGTLDPKSNIGLTSVSVIVAWLGDLVAFVLACVGAYAGRQRAGAILWGLLVIVFVLGSAVAAALAWLASAVVAMPVPIH